MGGSCKEGSCVVTVQTVPIESITVSPESVTIGVGETCELSVAVTPANATEKITWRSTDETVAKVAVNSSGRVTVTAQNKGGTVHIIAQNPDATVYSLCSVTVDARPVVTVKKKIEQYIYFLFR